jgi:hypothetical protein
MKVPTQPELTHLQLQAMLKEHTIPEDQMKYLGEREYTTDFKGHPEYHGQIMPWYLIGGEHEVPVCDIQSVDRVDEDES